MRRGRGDGLPLSREQEGGDTPILAFPRQGGRERGEGGSTLRQALRQAQDGLRVSGGMDSRLRGNDGGI